MKHKPAIIASSFTGLIALIVLSGCGGLGLPSVNLTTGGGNANNSYAGTFGGTWSQTAPDSNGTATINISNSGVLAGTLSSSSILPSQTVSGSVDNNGNAVITVGSNTTQYKGVFAFNSSQQLVGTVNTSQANAQPTSYSFTLTKQ